KNQGMQNQTYVWTYCDILLKKSPDKIRVIFSFLGVLDFQKQYATMVSKGKQCLLTLLFLVG
ncbi:MAG: hypothetical protein IJ391_02200, partial [Clostridia bacterium]|nr:hypothetical protein [Clostridia bacterium]